MHVGLDARMIAHSGIGVYLRELVAHLPEADPGLRLTLFGDRALLAPFESGTTRIVAFTAPIYGLRERRGWPREARECDVLHSPHYCAPGHPPRPMAVTIHDLIHVLGPGQLRGLRGWWARRLFSSATEAASTIVCDSEATRNDLLACVPAATRRPIRVVPLAAASRFSEPAAPEADAAHRHALGLPEQHWLGVGIDKPHKRWDFAVRLAAEHARRSEPIPLVLAGPAPGTFACEGVRVLPPVAPEAMPALFRSALALLCPSVREGFGLPAIEAMAAGCPVLAARSGSLPEVVGDGGVLLPAEDMAAWLDAMGRVAGDAAWRADLVRRGKARAGQFSWGATARAMASVWRSIA